MPDITEDLFNIFRNQLYAWLLENTYDVIIMSKNDVKRYDFKGIVDGWTISLPETNWRMHVLIESTFPFRPVKVAYIGDDQYLKWPHLEEQGVLCLPENEYIPIENLDFSIRETLASAQDLLSKCCSLEYVFEESAKEFQSYWHRHSKDLDGNKILSLLDLNNRKPRKIAFNAPRSNSHWIIGESDEQIRLWLTNSKVEAGPPSYQANLVFIDNPPSLPFPSSGRQFVNTLLDQCPHVTTMLSHIESHLPVLIVFAIDTPDGIGLIGAEFPPYSRNGFQTKPRASAIRAQWIASRAPKPTRIYRADSSWIHGRDQNSTHRRLADSHAVAIGAGSLGSQVISRLGEAGVGKISIIDPDYMDTSNAGRHALGVESYGLYKTKQLASDLSKKYPHSSFISIPESFQNTIQREPEIFETADVIICCVGDPSQELFWDNWRYTGAPKPPVVYGWIGTQGTTGHALALGVNGPGLSCFLNLDGSVRYPDTFFMGETQAKVIPGCGTEFHPYGPLAAGRVELLVSRLIIDILSGTTSVPEHRVYACSDSDLKDIGGAWTYYHQQYRPQGYDGPFEYRPAIENCGACYSCAMNQSA